MICNRCGKEMTKELSRIGSDNSYSWWCPFCGSTESMYSDKKKTAEKEGEKPPED